MAAERRYVLILDKKLDFIRLFRADCPVRPEGKTLWEGDGLRRAYDAMMELNSRRKPITCYHVCSAAGSKGKLTFKVFKSGHPKVWDRVSTHTAYKGAMEAARTLRREYKEKTAAARAIIVSDRAARRAENNAMLARLRKVGVTSKRVPKLTDKDLRYLAWIEAKRELFKDAA
jgi:hypothetical protein|nr:hypothetical protein [Neorhizobium tomejilense]